MSVTVTYSTPLPFIMEKAAYAVYAAETSETQRDRRAHYAEARAYVLAAEIIIAADDTKDLPRGVANVESLPRSAVAWLVDFIHEGAGRELLGDQFVPAAARPGWKKNAS